MYKEKLTIKLINNNTNEPIEYIAPIQSLPVTQTIYSFHFVIILK